MGVFHLSSPVAGFWLHFLSAQLEHPKPSFFPHRLAGGVGSQLFLTPAPFSIHKTQIFQGLPCLPLPLSVSPFFKVIFLRNTWKIPRINVCSSVTSHTSYFIKLALYVALHALIYVL